MEEQRDERLWQLAKKRAAFKQHLVTYVLVNVFLWIIWWLTTDHSEKESNWPWPTWASVIWGIFVVLDYFESYVGGDKHSMTEREYEKLKKKRDKL